MNGPRLQTTMIDGAQNCVSLVTSDGGYLYMYGQHATQLTATNNVYNYFNDYYLADQWNGRQSIVKTTWYQGDTDYSTLCLKVRYALATTTPGWYIIVSQYGGSSWIFHYAKVGKYPIETTVTPKTFTVKFRRDEWGVSTYSAGNTIGNLDRTSTSIYMGNVSYPNYIRAATNTGLDGFSSTAGYLKRTIDDDEYCTQTFEFMGAYYAMKSSSQAAAHFPFYPLKMENRKFGVQSDQIIYYPANSNGEVAKVYSPQKGCYCLKSYVNGEIPILNE